MWPQTVLAPSSHSENLLGQFSPRPSHAVCDSAESAQKWTFGKKRREESTQEERRGGSWALGVLAHRCIYMYVCVCLSVLGRP